MKTLIKQPLSWMLLLGAFFFVLIGCEQPSGSGSSDSETTQNQESSVDDQVLVSTTISIEFPSNANRRASRSLDGVEVSEVFIEDVDVVTAVVKLGDTELLTQDLVKFGNRWEGVLENLPANETLTFEVAAYDDQGEVLFTGVSSKVLGSDPEDDKEVTVFLGEPVIVTLPQITGITLPGEIEDESTVGMSFRFAGPEGEDLSYSITPETDGGSFSPTSGTVTPPASGTVTLLSDYTAPATTGTYTHSVQLSNQNNFSIQTQFQTNVVLDVEDASLQVVFNPWINGFHVGPRVGSDLQWNVEAADDLPVSELTYLWEFAHDGSFPNVSFTGADTATPVMNNYDETVEGTVTLTLTDLDGGSTVVTYTLVSRLFPDCIVNCSTPLAVAGPDQTVDVDTLVTLDGSGSSDPNGLILSYDWTLTSQPAGSVAALSDDNTDSPSFTPDVAGIYTLNLVVDNGTEQGSDVVRVTANTVADPDPDPVSKPTLVMNADGGNNYSVTLQTPVANQTERLISVALLGITCSDLSGLSSDISGSVYDISSSQVPFTDTFSVSIEHNLDDPGNERVLTGSSANLFSFTCSSTPTFNVSSQTGISLDTSVFEGSDQIDVQGLL